MSTHSIFNYHLLLILLTIINFQSSSEGFLQASLTPINPKTQCQNDNLNNFSFMESIRVLEENSGDEMFKTHLSEEERQNYESMLSLKRSFAGTMSYIPQAFNPEKEKYWDDLQYLVVVFAIIAIFPFLFILFYLITRFVRNAIAAKKGKDLYKISDINKNYRNISWVMLLLSSAAVIVLFSIIFSKSVKVNNAVKEAFDSASKTIAKSDKFYEKLNAVVEEFRNANMTNIPSEKYMEDFQKLINTWIDNTKSRTKQISEDDNLRQLRMTFLYIYYIVIIVLAYLFFLLKLETLQILLTILMLFTLPAMLVFEGYNARFFFYYTDLCDSVNSALYSNEFPVADQSLGYYYNCFTLETKAKLYNIRYKLYENVMKYNEDNEYYKKYDTLSQEVLQSQFDCEIVSDVVPEIEKDFCKDSLNNVYTILLLMTWLFLAGLALAIANRRMEVLTWKKKNEIESMIKNLEIEF